MRIFAISLFLGVLLIGACTPIATPLPQQTATFTAIPTETVSAQQMTESVGFRLTLPPSFTPTFTPSASPTSTSTFTPTATATATTIPADVLCDSFTVSNTFIDNQQNVSDMDKTLLYTVPYQNVTIVLEIINLETGETIEEGELAGGEPWRIDYRDNNFPDIGTYQWIATLTYQGETGLCERTGEFATTPEDLETVIPEVTVEVTSEVMGETTPEVTVEVTSEVMIEITPEVTPELTPEVTEVLDIAPQPSAQPTPTQSFQFPPR